MKKLKLSLILLLILSLLSGCGSMTPKNKTILLSEGLQEEDQTTDSGHASDGSYEVKKITKISMEKLDPNGIHPDLSKAVVKWLEGDKLFAVSVQQNTLKDGVVPDNGVEQQDTRVLTQFASISSQYGFYDPIYALADANVECCDLSFDGKYVACVIGNTLQVYDLESGSLAQSLTREVLSPKITFDDRVNKVYFTSGGTEKKLEELSVTSGVTATVQEGATYRCLAACEKRMVLSVVSQGTEEISYMENGTLYPNLLQGKKSASAQMLLGGGALLCYDDALYMLSSGGAALVQQNVNAFSLAGDGMHIFYAVPGGTNLTDLYMGLWNGARITEVQLIYKGLNLSVNRLLLSPDMDRLYLQGNADSGVICGYTFDFR